MKRLCEVKKVFLPVMLLLSVVPAYSMHSYQDLEARLLESGQSADSPSPGTEMPTVVVHDGTPDSSPARSDRPLLGDEETSEGWFSSCRSQLISKLRGMSLRQKKILGYAGTATLAALNEVYSAHVNSSYGFPLALFIGQCTGVVATGDPYKWKLLAGTAVGAGVSLVDSLFIHYDPYLPVSAAGFILWTTVKDLMDSKLNSETETTVDSEDSVDSEFDEESV